MGSVVPSVDAFTATNLSKFSSTSTRMASERESSDARRRAIAAERSWYVAFGCTTERKVLGLNDLDVMSTAASEADILSGQEQASIHDY